MGVLGKLVFWKKKDETALGTNLGLESQYPQPGFGSVPDYSQQQWSQPPSSYGQQPMGMQQMQPQPMQMDSLQSSASYAAGKQLELVSAKLDALKAAIDALNQRMANIERMIDADYFRKRGW